MAESGAVPLHDAIYIFAGLVLVLPLQLSFLLLSWTSVPASHFGGSAYPGYAAHNIDTANYGLLPEQRHEEVGSVERLLCPRIFCMGVSCPLLPHRLAEASSCILMSAKVEFIIES